MSAIDTLTAWAAAAMKPLAKSGGFRKDRLTYRRRHGETTQVLQFQLSSGNTPQEARAYVNVGIDLDAVHALAGEDVPEKPKEYECAFRCRLEHFVPAAPADWTVTATTAEAAFAAALGGRLADAVARLDRIDGPAAMLAEVALDRGTLLFLQAQLAHVTGDDARALEAMKAGAASFADRGMKLDAALKEHHLQMLRPSP